MSMYDILMLAVFAGSILFGLWKGLAWQLASLAAIFVSYFVALHFRGALSPYISATEPWNQFAAMLILFLGTSLVIWMLYGYMQKTIHRLKLRGFDSQAGAILGAVKGALLCMLITLFAVSLFGETVRETVINSRSGGTITAAINRVHSMVPSEIHAVLDKHIQKFNNQLSDQDADFLRRSVEQFDQRIETIRGKFQVPVSHPGSQDQKGGSGPGGQAGDQPPSGLVGPSSSGTKTESRSVESNILDAVKEAGRRLVEPIIER